MFLAKRLWGFWPADRRVSRECSPQHLRAERRKAGHRNDRRPCSPPTWPSR